MFWVFALLKLKYHRYQWNKIDEISIFENDRFNF